MYTDTYISLLLSDYFCSNFVQLAALALQSELGSYEEDVHNVYFISEFRFVPTQSEDFELQVLEEYKNLQAGMTPAEAEKLYLEVSEILFKNKF